MDQNRIDKRTYEALRVLLDYCSQTTDAEGVLADELDIVGEWTARLEKQFR